MLYSATMPPWVLKIGKRYLKNNYKHINLVGEDTVQTSTTIEVCIPHIAEKQTVLIFNDNLGMILHISP